MTASLTTALATMKYFKKYSSVDPYFVKPILDIMKSNDVQLKHFGSLVDSYYSCESEVLKSVQETQSVPSISSLAVSCGDLIYSIPHKGSH